MDGEGEGGEGSEGRMVKRVTFTTHKNVAREVAKMSTIFCKATSHLGWNEPTTSLCLVARLRMGKCRRRVAACGWGDFIFHYHGYSILVE